MNVILFGPPGIGKSTIVGALKLYGAQAIDLEDLYPSKIRFQLPSMVRGVFIGAADLDPRRSYNGSAKVLLYMDQNAYEKRRAHRDSVDPTRTKRQQAKQSVDDWLKGAHYDYVLDTTGLTPTQAAQKLYRKYYNIMKVTLAGK